MVSELYSFQSHFLNLDGLRYHYLDEGDGDPIVMVHGNPTWSFYFRDLVRELRPDYRVVAPDHIGCGMSDKPSDANYNYTLSRRVDDLERLLESLDLTRNVTLVLHDWGGMIGMTLATRHPDWISRLVILNTAAFLLPASKPMPWRLSICRAPVLGGLLVRGLSGFSRAAVRMCTVKPLPPAVRDAYLSPYDSWEHRIAVHRFVQDIPLAPGDRAYETVTQAESKLEQLRDRPMLICWGDQDFVFDHHFLAEWQRRFPEAEVHQFPDAGHFVLEDAGDKVRQLVRDFLTRHPLLAEDKRTKVHSAQ